MSAPSHIQEIIQDVYQKYKDINEGEVATYIPELAKVNPGLHAFEFTNVGSNFMQWLGS